VSWRRISELFSDGLSPVLVKDLRQTLGGRLFATAYLVILVVLGVAAMGVISFGEEERLGTICFLLLHGAIVFASVVVVPAQLLFSTSGRWSLAKVRQMQLTNMRPIQFVVGRLLSAGLQIGIFCSALLPFLVLSFVLPGIEWQVALLQLVATALVSFTSLCITIGFCWLTSNRILFSLASLFWILHLLQLSLMLAFLPAEFMDSKVDLSAIPWSDAAAFIGMLLTGVGLVSAGGLALAVVRLRHPEENRSTPFRLLGLAWVLASFVAGSVGIHYEEGFAALPAFALLALLPLFWLLLTEPARLGHRVRQELRERKIPFAFLLGPSGGTAVLYTVFLWALVCLWLIAVPGLSAVGVVDGLEPASDETDRIFDFILAAPLYFLVSALLIPGVCSPLLEKARGRVLGLFAVPVLLLLANLIPLFLRELFGDGPVIGLLGILSIGYLATLERSVFLSWLLFWLVLAVAVNGPRTLGAVAKIRRLRKGDP
jgi:hypothetical protein